MRGKEGSRVTTRAREWIVTGSLEMPEAQPVVSNHYYYTVNSLARYQVLLCIIAILFCFVF